jgi:hypothetical protein
MDVSEKIRKKEKIIEELREEILKISREESIRVGQDNAIREFSKFWVNFEESNSPLLEKQRVEVEEAIRNWIDQNTKREYN